jgi:CTD kinase subunit gamma
MADPFEVRQRFTTLLSHLSASHTSIQKAAVYALKNRDMDEDLHSCILEQLERTNMNTRANIMFFIECLCEMAVKEGPGSGEGSAMGFVRMLQRDILRVVECVVGEEGANVRVVRKVCRPDPQAHFFKNRFDESTTGPPKLADENHTPPRDCHRA